MASPCISPEGLSVRTDKYWPSGDSRGLLTRERLAKALTGRSAPGAVAPEADVAGSDVDALARKGVPSFSPIQDSRYYFNYHHTAADTFDKVDPRELAENAAVMAVLAYALADSATVTPR